MRYGRAFVRAPSGERVALETRAVAGGVSIRVPAAYMASATFPLVIDPLVSTFAVDVTDKDNYDADVAYDATSNRYLVVYEETFSATDHDVHTQACNSTGGLVWGTYADFTAEDWRGPKVASLNEPDQFMVVAAASNVSGSAFSVARARQTPANAAAFGPKFDVSSGFGDVISVDIGGDPFMLAPSFYCVVWEREFSATDHDIHARLVRPDMTLAGVGALLIDNTGGTFDTAPSISKSNSATRWSIAWQREASATNRDIRAAQVHWDGTIDSVSFSVTNSSSDDTLPSVSSPLDNGDYLIAWQRQFTPDKDIYAAYMTDSSVNSVQSLSSLEAADLFEDQQQPSVDSDGRQFALVYSESFNNDPVDYDPYVASFHVLGGVLGVSEAHRFLAFTSRPELRPELCSRYSGDDLTQRRYFCVWDDQILDQVHRDIEGALYDGLLGGPIETYCFGDGSGTPCPCGNNGSADRGCASSTNPAGAMLIATGAADLDGDTLTLLASGMPPTTTCLFFQGTTPSSGGAGVVFGDGLRCASGSVVRLGTKTVVGGNASYPTGADADISVRGMVPAAGAERFYQAWYRNSAAFCTPAGFNLSNGLSATWLP